MESTIPVPSTITSYDSAISSMIAVLLLNGIGCVSRQRGGVAVNFSVEVYECSSSRGEFETTNFEEADAEGKKHVREECRCVKKGWLSCGIVRGVVSESLQVAHVL